MTAAKRFVGAALTNSARREIAVDIDKPRLDRDGALIVLGCLAQRPCTPIRRRDRWGLGIVRLER